MESPELNLKETDSKTGEASSAASKATKSRGFRSTSAEPGVESCSHGLNTTKSNRDAAQFCMRKTINKNNLGNRHRPCIEQALMAHRNDTCKQPFLHIKSRNSS
jgi:hypothetical protein